MSSDKDFVDFITDQIEDAGAITSRKMFGEYALYCNGKVIALICDNQLFVKPTAAGRAYIGDVDEAPPYPGAKMYYLIEDRIEDSQWITDLIRITADELPEPKPKKKKGKPLKKFTSEGSYNSIDPAMVKKSKSSQGQSWSQRVTEQSDALDLDRGVFTWTDPKRIAMSLKHSAEISTRRKSPPFRSAMSMLIFYINRAGKNLDKGQLQVLEQAKQELRILYGKDRPK